ncbi:hypothetical protein [Bacillus swezeyi]|nr:hypothetical protein [Bacillus swezeyi]
MNVDEHFSKLDKVKDIARKIAKTGYNELKDFAFASKVLAELIKN